VERPKVGVGVIVVKDNKILFQKRKNSHGDGTWSFPGGHLEFNETPEECAKRETYEEFGIKIKNVRFAGITNDLFTEGKHYITIFIISDYDSGEITIREPDKSEAWELRTWDNLPEPLFLPIQNLLKQGYNPFSNTKKGKYQHYKGNYYELLHEGRHSETHEDFVVYRALYDSPEFGKNFIWIRPKKMFTENVIIGGKEVPRFRFMEE